MVITSKGKGFHSEAVVKLILFLIASSGSRLSITWYRTRAKDFQPCAQTATIPRTPEPVLAARPLFSPPSYVHLWPPIMNFEVKHSDCLRQPLRRPLYSLICHFQQDKVPCIFSFYSTKEDNNMETSGQAQALFSRRRLTRLSWFHHGLLQALLLSSMGNSVPV